MIEEYEVCVSYVKNDKTGKVFPRGEIVTENDFPKSILKKWVKKTPPVVFIPVYIDEEE